MQTAQRQASLLLRGVLHRTVGLQYVVQQMRTGTVNSELCAHHGDSDW